MEILHEQLAIAILGQLDLEFSRRLQNIHHRFTLLVDHLVGSHLVFIADHVHAGNASEESKQELLESSEETPGRYKGNDQECMKGEDERADCKQLANRKFNMTTSGGPVWEDDSFFAGLHLIKDLPTRCRETTGYPSKHFSVADGAAVSKSPSFRTSIRSRLPSFLQKTPHRNNQLTVPAVYKHLNVSLSESRASVLNQFQERFSRSFLIKMMNKNHENCK